VGRPHGGGAGAPRGPIDLGVPHEVDISSKGVARFRSVLSAEAADAFERGIEESRELLDGRVVWNVNSTARGGGVAELLQSLVAYARGAGVDARWAVIDGTPEFFSVTKRIHNHLHGSLGDGGALDEHARGVYESVLDDNAAGLAERVQEGDIVIVHDPQPAGIIAAVRAAGASAIWRCHVGLDHPNELARGAWAFLRRYVEPADAYVFSREAFAWEGLDRARIFVIPPTIDPFAPKNEDLDPEAIRAILGVSGVVPPDGELGAAPFTRLDGTPGRVERVATMIEDHRLRPDDGLVVQVSRWDALKDPVGVIRGFAHVPEATGAHLVYAGPAVEAVADDPEGERVLREAISARSELPQEARRRVHLATLPMDDPEENAVIVNALQRHARVIVQKSLAEGFGLTVAEAMWKGRPVMASKIGGIQEQIVDGDSGLLLDDPADLRVFGAALTDLFADERRAERIGTRARERVREGFLSPRSLLDHLEVIRRVVPRPVTAGGPITT
jgi:trehalose synthase